ncbi:MAG: AMP-binding protein [bacterium]
MQIFHDLITFASDRFSSKTSFEIRRKITNSKVTYQEIPGLIQSIYAKYLAENTEKNDKVLIWGMNSPEYALLLLSMFDTSRIAVPVDYRNSDETITKIITQTKIQIAFVSKYLRYDFLKLQVKNIFIIEDLFDELTTGKPYEPNSNPDQIAELVYTSGTTGEPKGVILTHRNILENLQAVNKEIPKLKIYQTISILPLSHMLEQLIGLYTVLYRGGKIIYLPRINSFKLAEAMNEFNPSYLVFVPQLFTLFWQRIRQKATEQGKLSKLEKGLKIAKYLPKFLRRKIFQEVHQTFGNNLAFIGTGGAALNTKIAEIWNNLGFEIMEGYGATEVTAVATLNLRKHYRFGSAGKPITGVNITLSPENEIIITSKSVSQGYFENPEKTAAAFKTNGYYTGDIGKIDNNGFFTISGRSTFKIVLASGEKIYVEDLENKIDQHQDVKYSCVLEKEIQGKPQIFSYLILESHTTKNLDTIISEINQNLESKQQIRNYALWPEDDFPRTNTLKTNRRKVASLQIENNQIISEHYQEQTAIVNVFDILANLSGLKKEFIANEDILSEDLNLDSLTRVELVAQIEEYLGVVIPETIITSKTTVADLQKYLENNQAVTEKVYIPKWQFSKVGTAFTSTIRKNIIFPLHGHYAKLEVSGIENFKTIDTSKGFIASFNHCGYLDGICVLRALNQFGLKKCFLLSKETHWTSNNLNLKIIGKALEVIGGGIPLYEKAEKLIKILKFSSDLFEQGYYMLYSPQGRLQTDSFHNKFNFGIGYIAKELSKPILPIYLEGYDTIWPVRDDDDNRSFSQKYRPKKRGIVKLIIEKPIYPTKNLSAIEITHFLEEIYFKHASSLK